MWNGRRPVRLWRGGSVREAGGGGVCVWGKDLTLRNCQVVQEAGEGQRTTWESCSISHWSTTCSPSWKRRPRPPLSSPSTHETAHTLRHWVLFRTLYISRHRPPLYQAWVRWRGSSTPRSGKRKKEICAQIAAIKMALFSVRPSCVKPDQQ